MDTETNLQELKDKIQQFAEERDWDQYHAAKDLSIGIVTEASELLEHFRFKSVAEVEKNFLNTDKRTEIEEELADVFIFSIRLAQRYGMDISEIIQKKMAKNAVKYPVEKCKGSNKKYTEL